MKSSYFPYTQKPQFFSVAVTSSLNFVRFVSLETGAPRNLGGSIDPKRRCREVHEADFVLKRNP
jgi:hypothetical protein